MAGHVRAAMQPLERLFAAIERTLVSVDRSRSPRLLFALLAVLLLCVLLPSSWNSNEENYFQLAYRAVAPEQFSPFHAAFDGSHARIVPEFLLGSVIRLLGYETAHAVLRIAMALLYAGALTYFFSGLRLFGWDALLVVMVFVLAGEGLMGGEWLFRGTEAKTLACALVFVAFGLAVRHRWNRVILACVAVTYMHFLVGGFWTLILLVVAWIDTGSWRTALRGLGGYILLTLPLAWLIAQDQVGGPALPDTTIFAAAARIYADRGSHHTAPFASLRVAWDWTPGIVSLCALLLALGILVRRHRLKGERVPVVMTVACLGLLHLFAALGLAYLDRHTQLLAKLYIFRPSALTLFLAITALMAALSAELSEQGRIVKSVVAATVVLSLSWQLVKKHVDTWRAGPDLPELPGLVAAVKAHTAPGEIVLIEPLRELDADYVGLHRHIPRPTLVSWKFVPTTPAELLRWHSLLQIRSDLFAHGCTAPMTVPVKWLVTLQRQSAERVAGCGPTVWLEGNVALIRVQVR